MRVNCVRMMCVVDFVCAWASFVINAPMGKFSIQSQSSYLRLKREKADCLKQAVCHLPIVKVVEK